MAKPEDRVIQLGDLMDRGPAPAECVRFARERGIEVVLGNHDEKHVRWRRHEATRIVTGKKNPMRPLPPADEAQNQLLSDEDVAWIAARPIWIDLRSEHGWMAVHAGFEPGVPLIFQDQKKAIRVRYIDPATGLMVSLEEGNPGAPAGSVPWHSLYTGVPVVFGHAVQGFLPRVYTGPPTSMCVGIDTGCVYGGALTALVLEGRSFTFAQVPARRAYYTQHVPKELE